MAYLLFSDSCCDLPEEILLEKEISVIPLHYSMDGHEYSGWGEGALDPKDFYDRVRAGSMPVTSQITQQTFMDLFTPYLQEGNDILYIAFSSALSGTCGGAILAARELSEQFPDRKIIVCDSLAAAGGEGLLVYKAACMRQDGVGIDEVAQWVEGNKLSVHHWFTVESLSHLKRGGRISATAAVLGSLLHIKPVLNVDNEGRLTPRAKVKGRKVSLRTLAEKMEQYAVPGPQDVVVISHGDCRAEAEDLLADLKSKVDIKTSLICMLDSVIGAHSGPGTMALFFIGAKDREAL